MAKTIIVVGDQFGEAWEKQNAMNTEIYTDKHEKDGDTALGTLGTKATPVDADLLVQRDSASTGDLVTSTWTQIKAFLKTYFDTLYNKYVLENHASNHTDGTDDIQSASTSQKGLLTDTDWNTFNNKVSMVAPTIETVTASRDIVSADDNKVLECSSLSAIVLTVTAGVSLPFGVVINMTSTGQVSIAASGSTVKSVDSNLNLTGQESGATLYTIAENVHRLQGDLA